MKLKAEVINLIINSEPIVFNVDMKELSEEDKKNRVLKCEVSFSIDAEGINKLTNDIYKLIKDK